MVSRLDVDGLGVELVRLYGDLERELAAGVARRVAAGIDSPGWLQDKLARSGEVRRWAETLGTRAAIGPSIRRTIAAAFDRGAESAQRQLAGPLRGRRDITPVQRTLPGAQAIDRLAAGLAGRLDSAGLRVARSAVDAYQKTVTAGAANVLGGALTRREAASKVWNRLLDKGLTGFTDVRGRNWSLAGYVDMATRTTTAQAAVAGQLDRQAQYGLDLVIVSNAPQECVRCRPWEGKVLTRDGSGAGGKRIEVEHATEDRTITVDVAGSVAEATAAGLLHPNCRHSLSAFLPGLTTVPPEGSTADPEGNAARERLRALERQVRSAKLQEAGALTPEAKAAAIERQKVAQAKIRQHVKDTKHLGIKRKPEREQLDLGNRRTAGGTPPTPPTPTPPTPTPAPRPPAPAPRPTPAAPASGRPIARGSFPESRNHLPDPELRARVQDELDRQAVLAPRQVDGVRGIVNFDDAMRDRFNADVLAEHGEAGAYNDALAVYDHRVGEILVRPTQVEPTARTVQRCVDSRWFAPCGHDAVGIEALIAHEFGHHMDLAGLARATRPEREGFWATVARSCGISTTPVGMSATLLDEWVKQNAGVLAQVVSRYAATDARELLAEIWQEYSTAGDAARGPQKIIGRLLQELSERYAS